MPKHHTEIYIIHTTTTPNILQNEELFCITESSTIQRGHWAGTSWCSYSICLTALQF